MTKAEPINTRTLIAESQASKHKESYKILEKNQTYHIGVGARVDITDVPYLFVEILINLSPENAEVDLPRLEKTLRCMKALQNRGYMLTYEDSNSIYGEKKPIENPDEEYSIVTKILANLKEHKLR